MFTPCHLCSALVFFQSGDLPVPPTLCNSASFLLLLHLTHQRHLVGEKGKATETQHCKKKRQ